MFSNVTHLLIINYCYFSVLGGLGNSRVIIRKKINGAVLADEFVPNLLNLWKRQKFVLEITQWGEVKLYHESNLYRPIVQGFDPVPLKVDYLSFKNLVDEHIDFFYDNNPADNNEKIIQELIATQYKTVQLHPYFANYQKLAKKLTVHSK